MSEPDEVRFACVGCGAMNPAGAEVCAGCGHRFAGPGGGPILTSGSAPATAPTPEFHEPRLRDDEFSKPARPHPDESIPGCLAKVVGVTVAVIATIVAFVVAFFVTCSATLNVNGTLIWSILAGITAAGLVVAFSVWVASTIRGR